MSIEELIRRLEGERIAAEREYNEALTKLGRAQTTTVPTLPIAPTGTDPHSDATRKLIALTARRSEDAVRFQHQLILFLQQITGMVDTRERQTGPKELQSGVVQARARLTELARDIQSARQELARDSARGLTADESRSPSPSQEPSLSPTSTLDAARARALLIAGLESQGDGSVNGLIAPRLVEYLEPAELIGFLDLVFAKLAPGAPLTIAGVNPACWQSFFERYITDLRHAPPLHPETLASLMERKGFREVRLEYRNPISEAGRLSKISEGTAADPELAELAQAVNTQADRLNARLFGFLDYEITARR